MKVSVCVAKLHTIVDTFVGGCIRLQYEHWSNITSDPEVLETVDGLHIELVHR